MTDRLQDIISAATRITFSALYSIAQLLGRLFADPTCWGHPDSRQHLYHNYIPSM